MKIVWDLDNNLLYDGLIAPNAITAKTLILRDTVPIELRLARPVANAVVPTYVAEAAPAGQSIVFGAKAVLTGTDLLADQKIWTLTGAGANAVYTANLWLGDPKLIAAIGVAASLALTAEFALRDADELDYGSTQFALTIKPDVQRLTDVPGSATQYTGGIWREEILAGHRVLCQYNSLGQCYSRTWPPGVTIPEEYRI